MTITERDLAIRVGRPARAKSPDHVVHAGWRNAAESFPLVANLAINTDRAGYLVAKAALDAFLVRPVQDARAVAGTAGCHHHVAVRGKFLAGFELRDALVCHTVLVGAPGGEESWQGAAAALRD